MTASEAIKKVGKMDPKIKVSKKNSNQSAIMAKVDRFYTRAFYWCFQKASTLARLHNLRKNKALAVTPNT